MCPYKTSRQPSPARRPDDHPVVSMRDMLRMSDGNETPLTARRACLHGSDALRLGTIRHLRVLPPPPSEAGFAGG